MSVSITDLLRASFRCFGGLNPGQTMSPTETTDALFILNSMLGGWAVDDLDCFCTLIQNFDLVAGQGSYTIGPGGNFDGIRPTRVDKATLVVLTNPDQPLRIDLDLLDAQQWELINLQLTGSTLTQKMFYNPTYASGVGLGTCNFWPVPTENDSVDISSMSTISAGFTSDSTFDAPPGYQDAVYLQLALRLSQEWGMPLRPGVADSAVEALAKIQRRNALTPQMDCAPGVLSIRAGRTGWSRLTGD